MPPLPDDPDDDGGDPLLPEDPLLPDEPDCGDGRELPEDPEPPMELELQPATASSKISTGTKTGLNNESIPVRQNTHYKVPRPAYHLEPGVGREFTKVR